MQAQPPDYWHPDLFPAATEHIPHPRVNPLHSLLLPLRSCYMRLARLRSHSGLNYHLQESVRFLSPPHQKRTGDPAAFSALS